MKNTKDMNQILKHLDKTLCGGLKKEASTKTEVEVIIDPVVVPAEELQIETQIPSDTHIAQVLHGLSKIASELEATNPEAAKLVDTALEVLVNRLDK
jgi:hypothetical protein